MQGNEVREPFILTQKEQFHLAEWETKVSGLSAGITSRTAGNFAFIAKDELQRVVKRRQALAETLGFSFQKWTSANQVHGVNVARIDRRLEGLDREIREDALPGADGLSTDCPGVLLGVYFADCVPLYFLEPVRRVVALAHAGWRGTMKGMAGQVLEHLHKEWGISASELWVAIGPSIGGCCYRVDEPVIEVLVQALPENWMDLAVPVKGSKKRAAQGLGPEGVSKTGGSHPEAATSLGEVSREERALCGDEPQRQEWWLDLKAVNRQMLLKAGVPKEHLWVSRYCTYCEDVLFFSHRREAGRAGRMVSWIGVRENG